jgi:hypothetical protein
VAARVARLGVSRPGRDQRWVEQLAASLRLARGAAVLCSRRVRDEQRPAAREVPVHQGGVEAAGDQFPLLLALARAGEADA